LFEREKDKRREVEMIEGKEERGTFSNPDPELGNFFISRQKLIIIHSF
jgi:hypothetical protein